SPLGPSSTAGLFVAGDGKPHGSSTSGPLGPGGNPVATLSVDQSFVPDLGSPVVTFKVTMSSPMQNPATIPFTISGTAVAGTDYYSGVNQFNIGTGQTTTTTQVQVLDDGILDSSESFTMAIGSGQGYTVGMPSTATVTILETPITIPSEDCGCGGT